MMKFKHIGLTMVLGLALGACATQTTESAFTEVTDFTCDHKYATELFDISIHPNPDASNVIAIVVEGEEPINFTSIEAASGAKYINDDQDIIFWTKGDEAVFIDPSDEEQYINCTVKA